MAAFHVGGARLAGVIRAGLRTVPGLVAAAAVCVAALVPEAGAVWNWPAGNLREIATDRTCPRLLVTIQTDRSLYYRCTRNAAWRFHSMVLPATASTADPYAIATEVLLGGCTVLLLAEARGSSR